jgi:hypothetical protein
MTVAELLADAFGRIHHTVHEAVDGLTPGQLAFRPDNGANSIAWLVWHLTRIQDDHVADDEQRVVIRVTPYATFETPPRHVWQMSDLDGLTHHTSTSMPW